MKTKTLLSLLIIVLISASCDIYDDLLDIENKKNEPVKMVKTEGELKLPNGTAINASELTIRGFSESVKAGQSESVSLSVEETDKPQVLFATNGKNEPVLLGLVDPATESFEVSARTTALSLVLMNPVFMMTSADQRSKILESAAKHPAFQTLEESIVNLLKTDPENVLDIELHPKIYEQAVLISIDLLKNSGLNGLKSAHAENDRPWLEPYGNQKVNVKNPKSNYFACSFNPSIDDKKAHLIDAKSSLVSFEFAWPPVYFTEPTDNYFSIRKDGNYQVLITKGFDFSEPASFLNYGTLNGKATLSNIGKTIGLAIDLVVGLDVPIGGLLELTFDMRANYYIGESMARNFQEGDGLGFMLNVCEFIETNNEIILYWLRTGLNPKVGSKLDLQLYLAHTAKFLKNLAMVTKIVSVGNTTANKLIPFVYDLVTSDKTISYTFAMKNGRLENSVLNSPPVIVGVTLSQNKVMVNSQCRLTVKSTDPENDQVSHRVHWGNSTASDWSEPAPSGSVVEFTYKYVVPGNYNILVEVKDSKESSGEFSEMIPISIYSESGIFSYDFESDMPDLLPMSPPWLITQSEPSYLRVTGNDGYNGSRQSCKFIDFDPGIINNKEDGGVATLVYNEKMKAQGSVKFAARVSAVDDAFGVRVWQDETYNWSQMGFYICFLDGYISYYHNFGFIRLMPLKAGEWYQFEVSYNTTQHQYNLYVNGILKGQNLPYNGTPSSLALFQAVAFSDEACRSAWLDDVSIPIDGLKSATVPKPVPAHAVTSVPR